MPRTQFAPAIGNGRLLLTLPALLATFVTGLIAAEMPEIKVDANSIARKTGAVTSYAPVVSNVAPSVVSVYTRKRVSRALPFMQDPLFRRFFGRGNGRPRDEQALGSGVVVSADGYILTNSHVVEGADEINVATADGREFPAKLIGVDSPTDVAVVKIEGTNLPVATLTDSSNVKADS